MVFELGKYYYYQDENTGKFLSGVLISKSNKFCVLENNGQSKRKSQHLLYSTEDEAKLNIIKKINYLIEDQFKLNILELSNIFRDMLGKYPEKFV